MSEFALFSFELTIAFLIGSARMCGIRHVRIHFNSVTLHKFPRNKEHSRQTDREFSLCFGENTADVDLQPRRGIARLSAQPSLLPGYGTNYSKNGCNLCVEFVL
jgi:hypothetical protein